MMEQKPVACLSKHDLYVTDYGSELCESLTDSIYLFAADQLKAEREMAIRRCMEIVEGHDDGYGDANVISIITRLKEQLAFDESKENEVKG